MDARELRIGNLVNYQTAEGDILVARIDWQDLKWISKDEKGFNIAHSAIPLTEEWLLKFGFKYKGNGLYTYGFKDMFKVNCHEFGIDFYYGNTYPYFVKPNFVHGLQNLYFALTREELTIKTK